MQTRASIPAAKTPLQMPLAFTSGLCEKKKKKKIKFFLFKKVSLKNLQAHTDFGRTSHAHGSRSESLLSQCEHRLSASLYMVAPAALKEQESLLTWYTRVKKRMNC